MLENSPQETLLYPLVGRIIAKERWPRTFGEVATIDLPAAKANQIRQNRNLGDFACIHYGLRYQHNVAAARRYLSEQPDAAVVNLGAGLDSLFADIDNGRLTYYNLDFAEVIAERGKYFPPHERQYDIACSMTDLTWLDQIDFAPERGIILLAAGVMFYLTVPDARRVVAAIGSRFPGGRFVFDSQSPSMVARSERIVATNGIPGAPMPFRVSDPADFATWSPHICGVSIESDFLSVAPTRKALPWSTRLLLAITKRAKAMYLVSLDFDGQS